MIYDREKMVEDIEEPEDFLTRTSEPEECEGEEAEKTMELIVFTNTGKTYLFKNVTNLIPTTQGFEFDYFGVATNVSRRAFFNYTSVSGYATK